MWELDYKESWVPKNWCFWTVVLEKTLKSPSDCKEIQPVHSEGDQSWIFIGRTDAEAEAPILWLHNMKNWLLRKNPDAGKDWRQEEKGSTEDEMVGWHHWLNGQEFKQTPAVGDGQGSLACCSPWGHKELDTMSDWTDNTWITFELVLGAFVLKVRDIRKGYMIEASPQWCFVTFLWSIKLEKAKIKFLICLGPALNIPFLTKFLGQT